MVHTYYYLNPEGMKHHAELCQFAAERVEELLGVKVGLKLTDFTADYPFWSGLDPNTCFSTHQRSTVSTQHMPFQQTVHLELGGINGQNAFSVRKITDWIDGGDKEKCVDSMNNKISDWLETRGYSKKGEEEVPYEGSGMDHALQEMIENSVSAGATKINIEVGLNGE
tara:strand:- start:14156 stop:14659 length:504 start_codon:yes stop_codon:yes gene_type:complete